MRPTLQMPQQPQADLVQANGHSAIEDRPKQANAQKPQSPGRKGRPENAADEKLLRAKREATKLFKLSERLNISWAKRYGMEDVNHTLLLLLVLSSASLEESS